MSRIKLTRQEMFDKAYIGVLTNGFSYTMNIDFPDRVNCKYRLNEMASDKIRCGIGHCIPDEMYTHEMENIPISQADDISGFGGLFDRDDLQFLSGVQKAHDDAIAEATTDSVTCELTAKKTFLIDMAAIASRYNLDIPAVEGDIT